MNATSEGRVSQAELALRNVRQMVLAGEFPAGKRLSEPRIAETLGISRTPLRQALSELVHQGILEPIPSGGCRVSSFSMSEIRVAIEFRGTIEGMAARMGAERGISKDQWAAAEQILADLDEAVANVECDFENYVTLNADLHELLAQIPNSEFLAREIGRIDRLPMASPSAFLSGQELLPNFQRSLEIAQSQHREIFLAIRNREGARADWLTREHARLAMNNLQQILRDKSRFVDRVPGLKLILN